MENVKRTPVFESYAKYGGKNVPYAGWEMPVEFIGLVPEHNKVRNEVGIFDVSHMGEITVLGKDALKFVNYLVTNDVNRIVDGQVMYTFMCYPEGGVVDDLLVYRFGPEDTYLVVNAANSDKDFAWIQEKAKDFDVEVKNISPEVGQVAVQGPKAQGILQTLTEQNLDEIKFFFAKRDVKIKDINTMISRTGYTGEDGFEIYCDKKDAAKLFEMIADAGVQPIGLGARDTLRFEANLPLYGQEMSQDITPLEAGYGYFVKLDKEDFIGKDALKKQKEEGLKRKVVGFEMPKGSPRHGYDVYKGDKKIGVVTTGYISPSLGKPIGNALLDIEETEMGNDIEIAIRNRRLPAKVRDRKFLKKHTKQ
ncbi:Aminomethyltransferase (glycine cleavage system T protein) [Clostridiaceae bacterium JG1575]|nr:Aminomethyltransferase (glycine cleavage system T protein) [Clostridiaceae bacterium JG1575]